jgi:hypothetical protein
MFPGEELQAGFDRKKPKITGTWKQYFGGKLSRRQNQGFH